MSKKNEDSDHSGSGGEDEDTLNGKNKDQSPYGGDGKDENDESVPSAPSPSNSPPILTVPLGDLTGPAEEPLEITFVDMKPDQREQLKVSIQETLNKYMDDDDPKKGMKPNKAVDFVIDILNSKKPVMSLDVCVMSVEALARSNKQARKELFKTKTKYGIDDAAVGGRVLFIKWLNKALLLLQEVRGPKPRREASVVTIEEDLILGIMELILSMKDILGFKNRVEMLKTKFGIDWMKCAEITIAVSRRLDYTRVRKKAEEVMEFLLNLEPEPGKNGNTSKKPTTKTDASSSVARPNGNSPETSTKGSSPVSAAIAEAISAAKANVKGLNAKGGSTSSISGGTTSTPVVVSSISNSTSPKTQRKSFRVGDLMKKALLNAVHVAPATKETNSNANSVSAETSKKLSETSSSIRDSSNAGGADTSRNFSRTDSWKRKEDERRMGWDDRKKMGASSTPERKSDQEPSAWTSSSKKDSNVASKNWTSGKSGSSWGDAASKDEKKSTSSWGSSWDQGGGDKKTSSWDPGSNNKEVSSWDQVGGDKEISSWSQVGGDKGTSSWGDVGNSKEKSSWGNGGNSKETSSWGDGGGGDKGASMSGLGGGDKDASSRGRKQDEKEVSSWDRQEEEKKISAWSHLGGESNKISSKRDISEPKSAWDSSQAISSTGSSARHELDLPSTSAWNSYRDPSNSKDVYDKDSTKGQTSSDTSTSQKDRREEIMRDDFSSTPGAEAVSERPGSAANRVGGRWGEEATPSATPQGAYGRGKNVREDVSTNVSLEGAGLGRGRGRGRGISNKPAWMTQGKFAEAGTTGVDPIGSVPTTAPPSTTRDPSTFSSAPVERQIPAPAVLPPARVGRGRGVSNKPAWMTQRENQQGLGANTAVGSGGSAGSATPSRELNSVAAHTASNPSLARSVPVGRGRGVSNQPAWMTRANASSSGAPGPTQDSLGNSSRRNVDEAALGDDRDSKRRRTDHRGQDNRGRY